MPIVSIDGTWCPVRRSADSTEQSVNARLAGKATRLGLTRYGNRTRKPDPEAVPAVVARGLPAGSFGIRTAGRLEELAVTGRAAALAADAGLACCSAAWLGCCQYRRLG